MTWEEYCTSKKIDARAFERAEPQRHNELKIIFEQVHPKSFTEQKKFLINDLRRKYHLKEEEKTEIPKTVAKPAVKIPPKIKKD